MKSTQLPYEGYQLATEYQLGELIRVYRANKRRHLQSSGWVLVGISLLLFLPSFLYMGFRVDTTDVVVDGICVFIYSTGLFVSFCTFHLKNGEKLVLSAYLEKQDVIKKTLDPRIQQKEVYPIKKRKDKYEGYKDIGHLAD